MYWAYCVAVEKRTPHGVWLGSSTIAWMYDLCFYLPFNKHMKNLLSASYEQRHILLDRTTTMAQYKEKLTAHNRQMGAAVNRILSEAFFISSLGL